MGLSSNQEPIYDAAHGEGHFLPNLQHSVPAHALDGGADELGTDVALTKVLLVHPGSFILLIRRSYAASGCDVDAILRHPSRYKIPYSRITLCVIRAY